MYVGGALLTTDEDHRLREAPPLDFWRRIETIRNRHWARGLNLRQERWIVELREMELWNSGGHGMDQYRPGSS